MNKIFSLKITGRLLVFMALVVSMFCANQTQAQAIATFPTTWSGIAASPLAASSVATNVASAQLARVGLTGVSSSARYNSSGWSAANYLTVTITASAGFVLNLNGKTLTAAMGSSGTGPNSFPVFSSVNSFATSIGTLNTSCTSTTSTTITFPATGYNGLSTITFRITGTLTGCSSTFGSGGTGGPASLSITGAVAANGPTLALANNGTQTTAQNITANTSGNVIAKAQLAITGATASISSIVFQSTAASTYLPADITSFRLYRSTNATYDGNAGTPTGSFIGSGVVSTKTTGVAENITFSTAQNSLAIATYYYYLVADIASGAANAHTINIAAQSTTNITSAGSTISGSTSATGASTIANKPVVSGNPAISGTTGVPFSYNIVATQSPASYAITSGTLPPPLSLNTSTGVISGIPNTGGTYSVTVTATNTPGGTSDAATLGFTIATGSLTDQSITFTPFTTPVTYGDPTFNLSATATSGLPVSFSSDNATVATVSGTTVTITGAGSVNIIANQAGDGTTYAAATPDTIVLVVNKASLSITNPAVTTKTYDATTAATITGTFTTAGGLVTAGDVAGLTLTGAGTFSSANAGSSIGVTANCTISGTKAIDYTLIQPTGLTGTINKANQTITFGALTDKTVGSGSSSLTASSTSALSINYTSSNPAVATVSGTTLTIVGLGSTIITAAQAGNVNYNAATSVQQTLNVTPAPVTLATWSNVNSTASATMTLSQSAANINTATAITTGVGLSASSNGSRFSFTGWNVTTNYISITVAASTGFILNLNSQSFSIALGSSNTGPGSFSLYSSVNNYAAPIGTLSSGASQTTTNVTLPATGYDGLSFITFRVVGSATALNGSATASGGTAGPSSISVTGSIACTAPGTPTASTPAAVCQGTSATITGAGGSAGSYTFWTAASGGNSITTATTPPGTVASNKLTTPTSLAAGSYTYYIQGENAGGCISAARQAVTVSIVALPVSNAGSPATVCNGGSTTLAANAPGVNTGAWSIVNGPSTDLAQFSSLADPLATFTPNGGLGVYTLRWKVSNATCSVTSDVVITSGGYSWTGAANSVWSNPANWTVCGVPTSGSDVSITNGTNAPVLDGDFTIGNLELQTNTALDLGGHTLTLTGAVSGDGTFKGSASSSMIIGEGDAAGTITFSPGSAILKDFTINTGAFVLLGSSLDIAAGHNPGTLNVVAGAFLIINDSLTLKSDINGTASAGNTDGGTIIGNVTVERYIPANSQRAWRLLSVPTQTIQTINQSWQEGFTQNVTGINGYGTIITAGASNSNWLVDGFDTTQNAGSMLSYNQAANAWDEINTTNGATGTNPVSGNIATASGYFLYIRGDRSQLPSATTSGTTATVLRTTGPLYQGTQAPITVPGNNYDLIGNIYASTIDFTGLTLDAGIDNKFYVWDPKLLDAPPSLGAYVTFSEVNNWVPVPGAANVGSYGNTANTLIQSGQAFFVHASSDANVTFTESAKVSGSAMVFRPAAPTTTSGRLTTNLYKVTGNTSSLADGNVTVFNTNYSNTVDGNDALKLSNTVENFGLARNSKVLIIEARQPVAVSDTIYFDMWNMQQQQYKLEFTPDKLNTTAATAILEDNYLGTKTSVSLNAVSDVTFHVNSNAASSAANRFRLILNGATPVPVTFTNIHAQSQSNNEATVVWNVSSATGIKQYEVEYSKDGVNFTGIGTVDSKGNGAAAYSLADATATTGINYYRVKAIGDAGDITYSSIANASLSTGSIAGITVYPNPVSGSQMHLLLNNLASGSYTARLLSVDGQELSNSSFKYDGTNNLQNISIPASIAAGSYKLEVIGKQVYTTTVIIN